MRAFNRSRLFGQGGKGARLRQSVWCCDLNYQRWRFLHGEFPGTHATHCAKCKRELNWPEDGRRHVFNDEKKEERQREVSKLSQRRQRARFLKAGLMTKGRPRVRKSFVVPSRQEFQWQEFRASLDIVVPEIHTCGLKARSE